MTHSVSRPLARSEGLILRELDGETLVYDRERSEATCLNEVVAKVWRRCDGATTAEGIAETIDEEHGIRVDERSVWLALELLSNAHLLSAPVELPSEIVHARTRRQFLQRVGTTAAIAVPVLLSITVPTPAQAASCGAIGAFCETNVHCCSGLCVGIRCL
ncbi:MAG: PqqD family protein [bacterium]